MARPTRVLSIGWFGERNLGDEAMLEGLLGLLRRALGDVAVTVTSAHPEATARDHGVRAIPLPPPERAGLRHLPNLRAAWSADLVTLGGGDLVRETARGLAPALYWLRRLGPAHLLGRPTALVGVSVGELRDAATIAETARLVGRTTLVAARDEASAARLRDLGVARPWVIGDLALEAAGASGGRRSRLTGRPPRIGVVTRELVRRGADMPADAAAHLERELAAALDDLVERHRAEVELIPFRTRPAGLRDDDRTAGDALVGAARTGGSWVRRAQPGDVREFARLAANLDVVVSVRLHGLVLGAAAGCPIVGLAYDPKIGGFLDSIGLGELALPLRAERADLSAAIERAAFDPTIPQRVAAGVAAARARTAAFEPDLAAIVRHRRLGRRRLVRDPCDRAAPAP